MALLNRSEIALGVLAKIGYTVAMIVVLVVLSKSIVCVVKLRNQI